MLALPMSFTWLVVVPWLVAIADIDRRTGQIPNALVLPAMVLTALVSVWHPTVGLAAMVAATPYAAAFAMRTCGGGDVKLAIGCGALVSDPTLAALLVVVAAAVSLVLCAVRKRSRLPHGPALAGSTVAFLVLLQVLE
ncbi:prepilin peptidase [Gordonia sp. (in: high G+C Gram-positive bacteria)]|uniref:prepilin peptidase n=1 Tax=Gordonia sp. (in: high G+C Gram-positive bacteria) TaxID=84139 RepID=UPI003C7855D5